MALTKQEIIDAIAEMSVLDLSELITEMEEKFGVTAAAAVAAAPAAGGGRSCCNRSWSERSQGSG